MNSKVLSAAGAVAFVVVFAFAIDGIRNVSAGSCSLNWDYTQPTEAESDGGNGAAFDYTLATSWTSYFKDTWDVVHLFDSFNSVDIASLTISPSSQEVPVSNPNVLEGGVLTAVDVEGTLDSSSSTGTAKTSSVDSPSADCSGSWSVEIVEP